jgi:hypothetical protein
MLRVSKNLLLANLLIGAALAGCGSDKTEETGPAPIPGLIQFSPMYSAYDGEHTYQISPFIPAANPANKDSDPVVESSIQWKVEDAFVKKDAFTDIPGAILLTTKKPGTTQISVTATRMSGAKIRGQSTLTISQASTDEWMKGDARYNNGMMISLFGGGMGGPGMAPPAGGMGSCGLPIDLTGRIPTNSACSNCHNNMGGLVIEHTPTQTAGYSNDELIEIFTNAQKPAGGTFNSPVLKNAPMPDCIYKTFHTWMIDDDTKIGIVWKLRSITPKKQEDIDFAKIAQQAAAMRRMTMGAAAGSGM